MSAKPTISVDVEIACDDPDIPHRDDIRAWVELAVCKGQVPTNSVAEVAVRVVDENEIRALNRQFRQQDKATNVLSFPAGEMQGLPENEGQLLGDIVICASIVRSEAGSQDKALADHWGHLLVHGTLHLLGYDHETDADAAQMEMLEITLLAEKGVADPYGAT